MQFSQPESGPIEHDALDHFEWTSALLFPSYSSNTKKVEFHMGWPLFVVSTLKHPGLKSNGRWADMRGSRGLPRKNEHCCIEVNGIRWPKQTRSSYTRLELTCLPA